MDIIKAVETLKTEFDEHSIIQPGTDNTENTTGLPFKFNQWYSGYSFFPPKNVDQLPNINTKTRIEINEIEEESVEIPLLSRRTA